MLCVGAILLTFAGKGGPNSAWVTPRGGAHLGRLTGSTLDPPPWVDPGGRPWVTCRPNGDPRAAGNQVTPTQGHPPWAIDLGRIWVIICGSVGSTQIWVIPTVCVLKLNFRCRWSQLINLHRGLYVHVYTHRAANFWAVLTFNVKQGVFK